MKIGIYGGTFDPVHLGHLLLAQYVLEELLLDKIIFIPASIPPHKKQVRITDSALRWEMLNLAIADNPAFEASRAELDRPGISYTVQTLETLIENFQIEKKDLFLLLGADSLLDLHKWYAPHRIFELCQVVVCPRPNLNIADAKSDFLDQIIPVKAPLIEISSTSIRQHIKTGHSIKYWVPSSVADFIEKHQLYRQSR